MSWLWGQARVAFHHAPSTVTLPQQGKDKESVDLASLCASVTPPCFLNPLLFNGHLQTMWTVLKDQSAPVHYRRRIFESHSQSYPGTFCVDFVTHTAAEEQLPVGDLPPRTKFCSDEEWKTIEDGSDDERPMAVILHGLAGGSQELYLRHVIAGLMEGRETEKDEHDQWEACVVNARGCAHSSITTRWMFNARATWDVRQMVKWLRVKYPNRKLFGIGFSLGGNILTNYLGEEGEECELKAAVVCSNPWNLEIGNLALQRTYLGREVYSKAMGSSLHRLFERHVDQISKTPGLDVDKVRQAKYLHEFDRYVQGPLWNYPTEGAYYRDATSTDSLLAARVPIFALHAEDDPVASYQSLPWLEVQQTPWAVMCTTSAGGHLGWFEVGGGRWYVKPVVGFLKKMATQVNFDALSQETSGQMSSSGSEGSDVPTFDPVRRKLHVPSAGFAKNIP